MLPWTDSFDKECWLKAQLFADQVISETRSKRTSRTESLEPDPYRFDMETPVKDMTDEEIATFAVLCRVRTCASCLADTEASSQVLLGKALDDLNQSLCALYGRITKTSGLVQDDSLCLFESGRCS